MKVISYNINGLRAALSKGWGQWLSATNADIVCLQEIRKTIDKEDIEFFKAIGYYSYWHSADKKGYSGVAVLSKTKAISVSDESFELAHSEGRILKVKFQNITVVSVYVPSGAGNTERQRIKYKFLHQFSDYLDQLLPSEQNVLVAGDFNICHKAIDLYDPVRYRKLPGFLDIERIWLDEIIVNGWIDTFRYLNPEKTAYTWWSSIGNMKSKDLGFRIDYILLSPSLKANLSRALILKAAHFSDHVPVVAELTILH